MSGNYKFLVLNPSPENLDQIFQKANLQNSKNGPFEATVLLGDVLPETATEFPTTKLDGATYFAEGKHGLSNTIHSSSSESDLVDVSPNLTFSKSLVNIVKLTSGLVLMLVSGSATADEESLLAEVKKINIKVDILVTYEWPNSIAALEQLTLVGHDTIDKISKIIKPRYHFAVGTESGKFFELEPFSWDTGEVTRFISLGQEGSDEKWFYAFSMNINRDLIQDEIPNLRTNPFTIESRKRQHVHEEAGDKEGETVTIKKPKVVSPESCFFCLSNPKTETHMIVSIGTYLYMTIAKGPLTRSTQELPFSGHGILVPIEHIPSIRSKYEDVYQSPVYQEILKYQNNLVQAFAKQRPQDRLIFFEVSRSTNVHYHVQFLPIGVTVVDKFVNSLKMRARLNNEKFVKNHKLEFKHFNKQDDPELLSIMNKSDYVMFTVGTPNDEEKSIYISELADSDKPIDMQFPRRVLAHTLNLPKRVYWDKCQQPKLKEISDCEEFKKFFHEFDITS
ncbi:uncharacterized protein J8A68_002250 [[Candida] subhashii]|uniref:CWF19-like protein DRN1 n=1 Tax=[Candida] subhashii TaxID=561895 RepID=A0A8J5QGK9_9ASCO|nr:uncharacterized protein J8A68_002250 [[Candida] subhashii]KAG7664236.1 hypothetical protein J8A68_002250 [[Candida] subhashii]